MNELEQTIYDLLIPQINHGTINRNYIASTILLASNGEQKVETYQIFAMEKKAKMDMVEHHIKMLGLQYERISNEITIYNRLGLKEIPNCGQKWQYQVIKISPARSQSHNLSSKLAFKHQMRYYHQDGIEGVFSLFRSKEQNYTKVFTIPRKINAELTELFRGGN